MAAPDVHRWQRAGRGLLVAGAVALAVAAALAAKERRLLFGPGEARGDVVAVKPAQVAGTPLVAPVVRFSAGGKAHVFTGRPTSQPYEVGDGVDVLYDTRDPDHATAEDLLSLWLAPLALLGLAVLLAGIGAVLVIAMRFD